MGSIVLLISLKPTTSNNIELAIGLKYFLVITPSRSLDGADIVYDGWLFLYNMANDIKMENYVCSQKKRKE